MVFITDNPCTMPATKSNLANVLSSPRRVLHRAIYDIGSKTLSLETTWLEPAIGTDMGTAPFLMKWMMAAHTVAEASQDMTGSVINNDSDTIDH